MRRSLAIAAFALAAVTATPVTAAGQAPPAPECDIFQNCICGIVASAVYQTTGIDRLHCA